MLGSTYIPAAGLAICCGVIGVTSTPAEALGWASAAIAWAAMAATAYIDGRLTSAARELIDTQENLIAQLRLELCQALREIDE